ncbi:hypothetical protein KPH14_009544 [Odynerus spinipes]|uniref:BBSome-interacting protein 1 n=1 Tax=Odynerus spinipes TaxID=1348599 RepID=A0AAD9RPN6_9HYME|nr:hypothetical protein KPH14_009544 [Odynerus spinipes]
MSDSVDGSGEQVDIIIPKQGLLYQENTVDYILCKPKVIPLKSVTLEKLERMQKEAEQKLKESQETDKRLGQEK